MVCSVGSFLNTKWKCSTPNFSNLTRSSSETLKSATSSIGSVSNSKYSTRPLYRNKQPVKCTYNSLFDPDSRAVRSANKKKRRFLNSSELHFCNLSVFIFCSMSSSFQILWICRSFLCYFHMISGLKTFILSRQFPELIEINTNRHLSLSVGVRTDFL